MSWAAAIAGATSIGGGLVGNQASARQQNRSQDFMAEMSNTAHRREVADLRAAGLNPILSATRGASTPNSSPAQMEDVIGKGVTSALDARRLKKEIGAVESQITLNESTARAQAASANRDMTTAKNTETQTKALNAQMSAIAKEAKARAKQADWDYDASDYDNYSKRISNGLQDAATARDMLRPSWLPNPKRGPKIGHPETKQPRTREEVRQYWQDIRKGAK